MSAAQAQDQNLLTEYAERLLKHEGAAELLGWGPAELVGIEMEAHRLYERGRYEEAATLAQGIITLENKRPYPYLILADIAYRNDQLEDALKLFTVADSLSPDNPVVLAKLGEALVKAGKPKEAAQSLARALKQKERLPAAQVRRVEVLYKVASKHVGN